MVTYCLYGNLLFAALTGHRSIEPQNQMRGGAFLTKARVLFLEEKSKIDTCMVLIKSIITFTNQTFL